MTEFETITKALDRIKCDYTFNSYLNSDDIEIEMGEGKELQLGFDKKGNLIEIYLWN